MSHRWLRHSTEPDLDRAEVERVIDANVRLGDVLDAAETSRLVDLTVELTATKRWEAVKDFTVTGEMIITIAANAAIPILNLDLRLYRAVRSVIVRPGAATSTGRRSGPIDGVVSDAAMSIIGEATPNEGPLSVSWDAALADSRNPANGRSVVIHEFAHKIDMSDGYTDGTPPLRGDSLERWTAVLADEYEHARTRPSDAALRPYAWTNRAEFFAVATEAFFCSAPALRDAKPALYEALAGFFGQDPAVRAVPPGS